MSYRDTYNGKFGKGGFELHRTNISKPQLFSEVSIDSKGGIFHPTILKPIPLNSHSRP
jgi:hypothetical protein